MSEFPTFDQIDMRGMKYTGLQALVQNNLRLGDRYDIYLNEVAEQYDAYCDLRDRPIKFGDWLKEQGDEKWSNADFFNDEQKFHLYAIKTLMDWKDSGRKPEHRSYKSQMDSMVTTTQDTPLTSIDCPRGYKRDISKPGGLIEEDTATAKVIYIGGFEYICRNRMEFKRDDGSKKVWWDTVRVDEPDGTAHSMEDIGEYVVMSSRLKRELEPPKSCGSWVDFAREYLLPIHIEKYGFIQPIERHMDWVEEHVMGYGYIHPYLAEEALTAAAQEERREFYKANQTALF